MTVTYSTNHLITSGTLYRQLPDYSITHPPMLPTLSRLHILYLGALPALGTLAITAVYGNPSPFLIWLGGVAAVAVYLATTMSYTPRPQSAWRAVLFLIDGPLFVLAAQLRGETNFLSFAAEPFLVDGLAVWAAIAILASHSDLPTSGQRAASLAIMAIATAATLALYWPYLVEYVWGDWFKILLLLLGLDEAIYVLHRSLKNEDLVQVDENFSILYIVGMLFLWMACLIIPLAQPAAQWLQRLLL